MKSRNLRYYLRGLGIGICVSVLIVGVTQRNQKTMTDEQVRERAEELGLVDSSGLVLADLQKDTPDNEVAGDYAGAENPSGDANMEMTQETATGETLAETQADETQAAETEEQLGADGTLLADGQTGADGTQLAGDSVQTDVNGTQTADGQTGNGGQSGTDGTQTGNNGQTGTDGTQTANNGQSGADGQTGNNGQTEADGTHSAGNNGQSGADGTQTGSNGQDDSQNAEIAFEIRRGSDSYRVSKDLEAAGLVANAKAFDKYLCDEGYSKTIKAGVYTIKSGESEAEIAKIITGKR